MKENCEQRSVSPSLTSLAWPALMGAIIPTMCRGRTVASFIQQEGQNMADRIGTTGDKGNLDWENEINKAMGPRIEPMRPEPSRGLKIASVFVGLCIVAVIGSVALLTVHWLFTRFW